MIKSISKLNKRESRIIFAVFMLAALLNQLPSMVLSQAMAQDSNLTDAADVYVASTANPDLAIVSESENENNPIIQNNVFLQPSCLSANGCSDEDKVQVREVLIQKKISRVTVTAYSSTPDQTDSTPFITANGTHVYDGIVACNFLPFDTKVKFPEMYGDKIFIVEDRMALKNSHKMDIWMPSRNLALEFGVRNLAFEIVE